MKSEHEKLIKKVVESYHKKLENEILEAILRGENPMIKIPSGEPWNAYVVDASEVYSDFPKPKPLFEIKITYEYNHAKGRGVVLLCKVNRLTGETIVIAEGELIAHRDNSKEIFWGDSVLDMLKKANASDSHDHSVYMQHVNYPYKEFTPAHAIDERKKPSSEKEEKEVFDEIAPISKEQYQSLGKKDDVLDHPAHYTDVGIPSGIECWDHYELAMTEEEFRGAMKNSIYKYVFRAGRKDFNKTIEDLGKAIRYLQRWIKYEEGNRIVWMRGKKAK